MADYLWHKVSEQEKEQIQEQAKKIILEFGDSLEKLPKLPESAVEREESVRLEGEGEECDEEFAELMLDNVPETKDKCIVAEKGKWVK